MTSAHTFTRQVGLWSAILTAILAALSFSIAIFATPLNTYPHPYTPPFIFIDFAWLIPAFLLLPAFVALTAAVHSSAPAERQVFGRIALSFAIISAVVLMADFFVQWTVVLPSTLAGETGGLGLFTQYNPHGLFVALEALGYVAMSAAFLFLAPLFSGDRLRTAVRWLFVAGFVLATGALVGTSLAGADIVVFEVIVITIDWAVLIVAGILIARVFLREDRQPSPAA